MQLSSKEAGLKVKSLSQLYNVLSQVYYLPERTSKSISKTYLLSYCFKVQGVFTLKKEEVVHHNFCFRKYSSCELLNLLEDAVKKKQLPPTGLDAFSLPDQDWMRNALLHLDPLDPHGVLEGPPAAQHDFKIEVNPEYEDHLHIFV